jgi:hypothetical protein
LETANVANGANMKKLFSAVRVRLHAEERFRQTAVKSQNCLRSKDWKLWPGIFPRTGKPDFHRRPL